MFRHIEAAPADLIFGVVQAFNECSSSNKVNLAIGAYRDDDGKPVVFDAVKAAGKLIYADDSTFNKEYLPMDGSPAFKRLSQELIFGKDCAALAEGRVATVQSMSGTGALSIVGFALRRLMGENGENGPVCTDAVSEGTSRRVYISDPTWPNHQTIFGELLGFDVRSYPYWNAEKLGCDIPAMLACLSAAPEQSIVILHACAHNPTGEDPTSDEWQQILQVVKDRKLFAILDCAYQGFATKDLNRDAYAVRLFAADPTLEFAVSQSYAKNMGLYGERAGCAHMVCVDRQEAELVHGRLRRFCRIIWSNPAKHGAELAAVVMGDAALRTQWEQQLEAISDRIIQMRTLLRAGLEKRGTKGSWEHITNQIGMFSYTGLTKPQVEAMINKHCVYLMASGRISMAGVNTKNIEYICDAIHDAVMNH